MNTNADLVRRALAFHQSGQIAEAAQTYQLAIDSNANRPNAFHLFGLLCHEQGDSQQAIDLISRAIAFRPDVGQLHNSLGVVRMAIGEWTTAAESLHTALIHVPTLVDAQRNLSKMQVTTGRLVATST